MAATTMREEVEKLNANFQKYITRNDNVVRAMAAKQVVLEAELKRSQTEAASNKIRVV